MLNASDGTTRFKNTPATVKQDVSEIAANGTPCFVIFAVNAGALPFVGIDRRIRPVE